MRNSEKGWEDLRRFEKQIEKYWEKLRRTKDKEYSAVQSSNKKY